jgi:hypothetical protein
MFLRIQFLIIVTLLFGYNGFSQDRYFTKSGTIYFMSHTDVIDIDGTNNQVVSFLDLKTGEIVFGVLIKSFEFTLATASEHFNETYMESHKFPKASFKGKVNDLSKIDFSKPGKYEVLVEGDLAIHGVTKKVAEKGILEIKDGNILANSEFTVSISDYNIVVPKIVEDRVAKVVNVKVNLTYKPYQK